MKWVARVILIINGGLFGYWCGMGGNGIDWWLWTKFMVASMLAGMAGEIHGKAKIKEQLNLL